MLHTSLPKLHIIPKQSEVYMQACTYAEDQEMFSTKGIALSLPFHSDHFLGQVRARGPNTTTGINSTCHSRNGFVQIESKEMP